LHFIPGYHFIKGIKIMSSLVALAEALISCPSVTPNDAGCQTILRERLEKIGFHCESMRFGEVDNLWARLGKTTPLLVFAGHTDVVPPGPESSWSHPPFTPTIQNGFLFGRGAADMKSAIAAMVIAVEKFLQQHPQFPGSIAFLITSDEEGPSIDGTKKVIETLLKRDEKIDYCIIGEASSEQAVGDQIRVGRRGSLQGKMRVHGKQGHVAHPHRAENPIHACMLALHELAHTEWDQGNEHFPRTTFQITNIHSGTGALNVIPGHLDTAFNFRFSTAVTVNDLQKRTENIFHGHKAKHDIEWTLGAEPFLTKQGKLISVTQAAIKELTALDTKLSTGGGTSDGRFIAPTGAEVIELGVCNTTVHQIDECVKVKDLEILAKCYERILEKLFLGS
jgi:succinyl-diaminopimelate desuccinylase